ncbi:MAG: O-acetyl-ADP-ribose deacetylase [Amphritea sp.]
MSNSASIPVISVLQDNLVELQVDAIVNAANSTLLGGGGVDGAIHRAAGAQLLAECKTLTGCKTGQAKLTHGYKLAAPWVIHTVGPIWQGGTHGEPQLLASCYHESLRLAQQKGLKSIAFPAISCGVYGYPKDQAVKVAVATVSDFLVEDTQIEKVIFCCFEAQMADLYKAALAP